jgi:hypothetical protein
MNINIPTIQTLYTFSEYRPTESCLKRKQYLAEFFKEEEYNTIEHEITRIAEYECEFNIPYSNHHIRKIDNNNYQIQIWNEGDSLWSKPKRIIDVRVDNVLSFNGRYFKLGEEVIV